MPVSKGVNVLTTAAEINGILVQGNFLASVLKTNGGFIVEKNEVSVLKIVIEGMLLDG